MTAAQVIAALGLKPHPEGGHYRETFRDPRNVDGRSVGTAIYFLLDVGGTGAPGFEFSGFEMAPPNWRPTPRA